jgi:hypothetical protein
MRRVRLNALLSSLLTVGRESDGVSRRGSTARGRPFQSNPNDSNTRIRKLTTQGKLQSEIVRTSGVSVMTLHRWHKAPPGPQPVLVVTPRRKSPHRTRGADDRIAGVMNWRRLMLISPFR